jgi:opacity protein-like surface antigen
MMVNGAIDLAPQSWRIRPFLTAGAGVASNATSTVVYSFPGIGPNAVTSTPGGQRTDFAWNAGAGATFDLCPNLALDLTLRHTNLGQLHSPRGIARIIRPTRTLELEIDETRGDLASRGVTLSLRWTR